MSELERELHRVQVAFDRCKELRDAAEADRDRNADAHIHAARLVAEMWEAATGGELVAVGLVEDLRGIRVETDALRAAVNAAQRLVDQARANHQAHDITPWVAASDLAAALGAAAGVPEPNQHEEKQ